jgi:hypothetical protein
VDEVLLGTLIFTGCIFLYPTIGMYYLCFVSIWLSVQLLQTLLRIFIIFLNNFPFFMLVMFYRRPGFFPGGVQFKFLTAPSNYECPSSYMQITIRKMPLAKLFSNFIQKISAALTAIPPMTILKNVVTGNPIPHATRWPL